MGMKKKKKIISVKKYQLPIHQWIKQIKLPDLLWGYDGNSIYPSAMWDENRIYPRIESGYAYTEDMNDEPVEKFKNGNFTQGSAVLRIRYYNPKNIVVQHLSVEEREKKIEINRMQNGWIVDTLTSVDIQENIKIMYCKIM